MSADNGIYILQSKDGFRATDAQAIENLYWWYKETCLCNTPAQHNLESGVCQYCGDSLFEERKELNPEELKKYFGDSPVFKTYSEILEYAHKLEKKSEWTEYGICFIHGWENKDFPV